MTAPGRSRRVLIVDDHPFVRHGVRALLEESALQCKVTESMSGTDALTKLRSEPWDAVILDLSLPDRAGLEVLKDIKQYSPALPVLVLSAHDSVDYALRALRSGASAYVTKSSAAEQLVSALGYALGGRRYIPPELAEQLAQELVLGEKAAPHDKLSDREMDILRLIASGKSNGEIGARLFISVKTVSTHRANILKKLNLQNTAELVRYALSHDLLH